MLDLAEPYEEVKDVIPSQDITGQDITGQDEA